MIAPRTTTSVAYHEAGHAVANVLAWQYADHTDEVPERLLTRVDIFEPGLRFGGFCGGPPVYSTQWPAHERIHARWRSAMEWQIVFGMAGGIAEAVFRGELRQGKVYGFASANCGMKTDMAELSDVMDDLYLLTRRRHGPQRFAVRTLRLVQAQWPAVEVLAKALQANNYINGDDAQQIVENNLTWCPIERRHLGVEG